MSPASYRAAPPRVGSDQPYVSLLAKPNRLGLDSTWRRGPLKPVCRWVSVRSETCRTLRERGQRAAPSRQPGPRDARLADQAHRVRLPDSSHKIIITTLAGQCYLSRRRSTMITGGSPSWLVHVGNVLPRLRVAHASELHHVGHDRAS